MEHVVCTCPEYEECPGLNPNEEDLTCEDCQFGKILEE